MSPPFRGGWRLAAIPPIGGVTANRVPNKKKTFGMVFAHQKNNYFST